MKICFFDIDGTLAIRHDIPQSNLEMLRKLKENGVYTFICTGRAPFYAEKMFGHLVDGIVSSNGRYITFRGETICRKPIDDELVVKYVALCHEVDIAYHFVSDAMMWVGNANEIQLAAMRASYGDERLTNDRGDMEFYTFDFYYKDAEQYKWLLEVTKDDLLLNDHGIHNGQGTCDNTVLGFDKGDAIAYLIDYFNINRDDTYAFGDGYNDQAMFREAGHGIAMGNGVDVLKEKAEYITDTIHNEGIRKALEHYKLV